MKVGKIFKQLYHLGRDEEKSFSLNLFELEGGSR